MTAREGLEGRVRAAASGAALEVAKPKAKSIAEYLNESEREVERALPEHLKDNAPAFVRAAITVYKMSPQLAGCDPNTVIGGMLTAAQMGFQFGPLGHVYLVPYTNRDTGKKEAQLQLGYKGLCDLAWRSGRITSICAEEVRDHDEFVWRKGTGASLSHSWDARKPRGTPYAWYCLAEFAGGGNYFNVLSAEDVERHRKRSKQPNKAWATDFSAMAKKSCVVEAKPWLPLSPEVQGLWALDGTVTRATTADEAKSGEATAFVPVDEDDVVDGELVDEPPDYVPGQEPFE